MNWGLILSEHHLSPPCSEVGHEGKCPEEIVGLGSWECGGDFHGWHRETGKNVGGGGGGMGDCLAKSDLQNLRMPPDEGAQVKSPTAGPSWPHGGGLDLLHGAI